MTVFKIVLDLDPSVFNTVTADIRVSSKPNNGIQLDESGALKLVSAQIEPGNARNTPGNSIAGNIDSPIDTIRLNRNVTRKIDGDPTEGNEGPSVASFMSGLMSYLMMGTTYVTSILDYVLTTEQPADWDEQYMRYYTKSSSGEFQHVETVVDETDPSIIVTINWAVDTFYEQKYVSYGYRLTIVKPDDWDTNYKDYFIKDDQNNFTNVIGVIDNTSSADPKPEIAPEWMPNTYYGKYRLEQ